MFSGGRTYPTRAVPWAGPIACRYAYRGKVHAKLAAVRKALKIRIFRGDSG
jgi:hypothetical protein